MPYAPSWGDGKDKYPWWKATFKEFFANHAEKLKVSMVPGQIWFLMTSAGQPVPANKVKNRHPKDGLAGILTQILEQYAQLPEAQRKPAQAISDANRPTVAPPPGGVVLTIFDRFLQREDKAEYHALVSPCLGPDQKRMSLPGPQRNSLWLTQAECQALMPANPKPGQTMDVPAKLARRISLFGLIPASAWQAGFEWKADSVHGVNLTLTVEKVSPSQVRLRIHGSTLLVTKTVAGYAVDKPNLPKGLNNQYDARLEGTIVYDPIGKKIRRWDMVALGDYTGICYAYNHPSPYAVQPIPLGFAFELDRGSYELPAALRRNKPMILTFLKEQFYFDPEKWEADWRKHKK